jgi:hypothetical protein
MEQINRLLNYLYADRTKANALETEYILFEYKPQDAEEKSIIDKAR